MIAVIFEVEIKPGCEEKYLALAGQLRDHLIQFNGFISIERFQSLNQSNKLLSLSIWQDEESVAQWRNIDLHRQSQAEGRLALFDDYTIRVCHVCREYTMTERSAVPEDSLDYHN